MIVKWFPVVRNCGGHDDGRHVPDLHPADHDPLHRRLEWLAEAVPILEPSRYGWTLEFCLALWVWIVFWGAAFVVRERDHVTFDVSTTTSVPGRAAGSPSSAVAVCGGLLWSVEPTWSKFFILRLKKTATLNGLFGDWIRMRDIYSVYIVPFVVSLPAMAGARSAPFAMARTPTSPDTTRRRNHERCSLLSACSPCSFWRASALPLPIPSLSPPSSTFAVAARASVSPARC
jgi:hypothetical protein